MTELKIPAIIVHGGAGNKSSRPKEESLEIVKKAAEAGYEILKNGGSALDAVEKAIIVFEDSGKVNAGVGSVLNEKGFQELDALIMDGTTLNFGAVMSVTKTRNPIALARYIMEKTPHVAFSAEGANKLYEKMVEEGYRPRTDLKPIENNKNQNDSGDTVGAVAVDSEGRIAVGGSTGGTKKKMVGRVGDTPMVGSGEYATPIAGAAATGVGEVIAKVLLSRTATLLVEQGMTPELAAEAAIKYLTERVNGPAGVIVLDHKGRIGFAHNTNIMAIAYIQKGEEVKVDYSPRKIV